MTLFQKLKPKNVCFSCYQDITRFNTFVQKIVDFREGKTKNILGKVPKGITIKKIQSNVPNEIKQCCVYDTLNLESVFLKTENVDDFAVKCEPMEKPSLHIEDFMETEKEHEEDYFPDDDDDYFLLDDDKNSADNRSSTRISDLNFTCANCKNSYSDFETLTEHITSRVRKTAINLTD